MRVLVQAVVVLAELADERTRLAVLAGAHLVHLSVAEWATHRRGFQHRKINVLI